MGETRSTIKELSGALAGASGLGYVAGYLSLRARAHTLGTSPAFELVDEAYVFAGFRLALTSLVVVVLFGPPLLLLGRAVAPRLRALGERTRATLAWGALLAAFSMTTALLIAFGHCSALLLDSGQRSCPEPLRQAVLGEGGGVLVTVGATLLPVACGLVLLPRLHRPEVPYTWFLAMIVVLQLCLLPIVHGALTADRKVRVLSGLPTKLDTMLEPVGIVETSEDLCVLYGLDHGGRRALVVVAREDLHGLPVREVVSLSEFARRLPPAGHTERGPFPLDVQLTRGAEIRPAPAPKPAPRAVSAPAPTATAPDDASLFDRALAALRITFEAIGSLGSGSGVDAGEVWEATPDANGGFTRRRLSDAVDLAWPVAGTTGTWALRRGRLVALGAGGASTPKAAFSVTWRKLVGVAPEGDVFGFVERDGQVVAALFTRAGELRYVPAPAGRASAVAALLEETRSYEGGLELNVDRSERGGRGHDVYRVQSGSRSNVSDCGDDSCAQPSLSSAGSGRVLYIRKARYE